MPNWLLRQKPGNPFAFFSKHDCYDLRFFLKKIVFERNSIDFSDSPFLPYFSQRVAYSQQMERSYHFSSDLHDQLHCCCIFVIDISFSALILRVFFVRHFPFFRLIFGVLAIYNNDGKSLFKLLALKEDVKIVTMVLNEDLKVPRYKKNSMYS